ncbi:MAG TPA: hypothetical protein ENI27_10570 [bacterium]|nr:hypothetical protein [bacterium]
MTSVENFSIIGLMKHLITHWQDVENNVFKPEPDDFILPEDDDGGEGRQRDADFNAEVKRIQEVLKNARQNSLFKHQAD